MNSEYVFVQGSILNPLSDRSCQYFQKGLMILKKNKVGDYQIDYLGNDSERVVNRIPLDRSIELWDYSGQLIMPGFFDMHFHWVQDHVREMPKDSLLEWLSKYTWPFEAKFKSKRYAKSEAKKFFKRLSSVGTIGGGCYSSLHDHALEFAQEEARGDFIIGNVLMTMNSPKNLSQTKGNALSIIRKMTKKYKSKYAMTPRFAPTTHPDVMKKGAELAKKNGSFIQTHLSETKAENRWVMSLFKEFPGFENIKSYPEIYRKCGLYGKRTIMGHGIYISNDDYQKMGKSQTAIAHCPTSNADIKELGLGSGLFEFKRAEKHKVPWALASDIGGGPFLSMFDVMRSFVEQNKREGVKGATFKKALYRSTLAGAKILGIDKRAGNLAVGKEASFIVVSGQGLGRKLDNPEDILKRLIGRHKKNREQYDHIVLATYLRGQQIH